VGVGASLKSLNFVSKKRNMEKMIAENLMLMKKIHFAQPTVQAFEHREHERNIKKLKKLVSFNSMRQSMITTVRNYFSGYEENNTIHRDKNNRTRASVGSGLRAPSGLSGDKIIY